MTPCPDLPAGGRSVAVVTAAPRGPAGRAGPAGPTGPTGPRGPRGPRFPGTGFCCLWDAAVPPPAVAARTRATPTSSARIFRIVVLLSFIALRRDRLRCHPFFFGLP